MRCTARGPLLLVLGLCAPLLYAQPPAADTAFTFARITTAEGITDNTINCLYQDRDGFLWIGTEAGLNKYDGNHVRTWRRSDGLGGEQVSDVLVDDAGICWAATRNGGLARIALDGSVRAYRHDERDSTSIATDRLVCLFDLNDTTLMIGAEQVPVLFMDKRTGRFSCWPGTGPLSPAHAVARVAPSTDWCHTIHAIDDRRLAVSFLIGHHRSIVDRVSGHVLDDRLFPSGPEEQTTSDIARIGDHLCGVGWQPQLAVRPLTAPAMGTRWHPLPDEGTSLVGLDDRHALVGLRTKGLALVDLESGAVRTITHHLTDRRSLADDRVRCLLRDDAGRIWVGTRQGLSVHDPGMPGLEAIPLYDGPTSTGHPEVSAYRIDLDAQGRPVVSTNDGLFLLDGGRFRHQVPVFEGRPQETTGLFHTAMGDLLGTEHGLYRYDLERNRVHPLTPPSAKGTPIHELSRMVQVRHAYADTLEGRPCLVVGVMGYGTVWFEPATLRSTLLITEKARPRSVPNNLTRELLRTRDGTYWSATPAGVFRWMLDRAHVENAFDVYRREAPGRTLPGNDVQDLLEDEQGGIWAATRDGGLVLIRDTACTAFPCPRPAGNAMFGLALDRRGRIWCTTSNGIEVFDPADRSFFHVAVEGMQGSAALGGAIATLSDGRIAFIAENTFFIADPERMLTARPPPAPYLTGMRVDGRPALDRLREGVVHLSADEHALALAVSALRLTGPGPMSFAVRLEGVDEVPHLARGTDEVTYASLPPGDFRLFARSVDSSGAPGEEVLLALVHVDAPFWQRWWFYALLAVGASAGVLGWSRYRLRQALALHAVRDRIASDLHDEVGSSLSSITIGSQLAAQLSKGEDEQVRQLIARIGETSGASLRSMSDIVWAIDPKNDEGEALVKRLRRIAQDLLESKGVGVSFLATGGVEELRLPMDVRKELLLIGKEAMHNVSKHAGARHATVTVDRADGELTLSVEDDGRGFDPTLHPDGHGLTSMQRRGAALGSTVRIDSAPGRGTRVTVRVDLASIRD